MLKLHAICVIGNGAMGWSQPSPSIPSALDHRASPLVADLNTREAFPLGLAWSWGLRRSSPPLPIPLGHSMGRKAVEMTPPPWLPNSPNASNDKSMCAASAESEGKRGWSETPSATRRGAL